MQIKGKQIKNYIIGDTLITYKDMNLLTGHKLNGQEITILMIDKKHLQQQHFVAYNNLLFQNKSRIHPQYIEPIQSTNNIYLIVEKINKLNSTPINYHQLLPALVHFYRNIGEFKVEEEELFFTADFRIVYLPFYKRINTSSKFYAQFHNKSILAQIFSKMSPIANKNRAFEIFIQNIDNPNAEAIIRKIVQQESIPKPTYPTLQQKTIEQDNDDEEILQLMSDAKVNTQMKKQAGDLFKRQSVRAFQQQSDKQMNNIMENVKSSMASKVKVNHSQHQFKTRMQIKINASKIQTKIEGNQFEVYFKSYCESLRFIKRAIKKMLEYYKTGFAGIVSSYLLVTILTLRKAYMIKDLQMGIDIFQLGINMKNISINKYVALLGKQLKSEARMGVELRALIENCQMPMKTFNILSQFLQEDVSLIDFDQLQTFTFFFLSALMKGKEYNKMHFLYMIETMYMLLHKNYQIVFFQSDFPSTWSQKYFDQKVALIEAILPNWSLK